MPEYSNEGKACTLDNIKKDCIEIDIKHLSSNYTSLIRAFNLLDEIWITIKYKDKFRKI